MHINKVHHVKTISRVAKELGEDEDWLFEIAMDMEIEDGVIWVYDMSDDGQMAFTDFGIENLFNRFHRLPLGGAYVGQGMTMSLNGIPAGVAVPGMGRSAYLGVNLRF